MDITKTDFHQSTLNNSLGNSPKVDGVIIYSLIKLSNVAAQPYYTQTERKQKYQQMKDMIFIHILPFLIPKVSRQDWAERYFKIRHAINENEKIHANLDYFAFLLEEAMVLIDTILYSNNYYMLEDFTDSDYDRMVEEGGVTIG
jgi:hypothetical protein